MGNARTVRARAAVAAYATLLSVALLPAAAPLRAMAEEARDGAEEAIELSQEEGVAIEVVSSEAGAPSVTAGVIPLEGAMVADEKEDVVELLSRGRADAPVANTSDDSSLEAALSAQSGSNIASGMWGTCPWEISSDGVLTIHPGVGENVVEGNYDYDDYHDVHRFFAPWYDWEEIITSVRAIAEGSERVVAPAWCDDLFYRMKSLVSADLSGMDTSSVEYMTGMFYDCSSLASLDISGWDTSQVTAVSGLFNGCASLTSLDISGWDTSQVEYMGSMFYDCSSLVSLDVSGWDTSQVEDMSGMFSGCSSLDSLDVSGWDTSQVKDMSGMFSGCGSLAALDVSSWDTSLVAYMYDMFESCPSLETLDISSWDTSQVEDMTRMFSGCASLSSLDVSGWDTLQVGYMAGMFSGCALDEFRVGSRYVATDVEGIPASRAGDGRWWSESDGAWYTRDEVAARSGVADTYLSAEDEAPSLARDGWVDLPRGGKGYVRNGALVKGWFDLGSSKYWFHPSGRMAKGWTDVVVSGNTMHYYFNPRSGNLVRDTWFDIGGTKYYFRPSGNMATGWATISDSGVDKKYYFDERGRMLTGWQDIDTGQGYVGHYYFRPSGAMATGWATIDGEKYWFRPSGNMATGFADVDDAYKRYFDANGRMVTGWRRIGSGVYYFRPSGAMQTGQATIDGVTYTFSAAGVLVGEPPRVLAEARLRL